MSTGSSGLTLGRATQPERGSAEPAVFATIIWSTRDEATDPVLLGQQPLRSPEQEDDDQQADQQLSHLEDSAAEPVRETLLDQRRAEPEEPHDDRAE